MSLLITGPEWLATITNWLTAPGFSFWAFVMKNALKRISVITTINFLITFLDNLVNTYLAFGESLCLGGVFFTTRNYKSSFSIKDPSFLYFRKSFSYFPALSGSGLYSFSNPPPIAF